MAYRSADEFPTTVWSVVRAAKSRHGPHYVGAMNRFVAGYWRPVFYFLRAKGYPLQRAEDLTQEFFLQFFERGWMAKADPERGRFRFYLLTILIRFLSDQGSERAPKQKQFDERLVSISALMGDQDRQFEPPVDTRPQDIFMKRWAEAIIDNVRKKLELWCDNEGRPDWFAVFIAVHFPPPGGARVTQQALADRFRMTRDQVRYGLEKTNQQFAELLEAEVVDQAGPNADVQAEIREIERLLEL